MKYDDILKKLGEFGPYQRKVVFTLAFGMMFSAFQALSYVFVAARVDHWCYVPMPSNMTNMSDTVWREMTVPVGEDYTEEQRQCKRFAEIVYESPFTRVNSSERKLEDCQQWVYDQSQYKSSIITQYDLVCGRKWLRSLSQAGYMAGRMISAVFMGVLADKFGRRPLLLVNCAAAVVGSLLTAFAPEFYTFAIVRFFAAIFVQGWMLTTYVLVMEVVGPSWRAFVGNIVFVYWAVGYMLLAPIAYYIRDHFYLQLATSLPFISLCGFYWLAPESPRWLLAKGKVSQAKKLLVKIAEANQATTTEKDIDKLVLEIEQEFSSKNLYEKDEALASVNKPSDSALTVLKSWYIWKWTLILSFLWSVCGLVYYGISFNSSELAGNNYINFFLAGAVEVPAYLICIWLLRVMGRQWSNFSSFILTGVSLLLAVYVPSAHWAVSVTFTVIGKFGATAVFTIIYVITSELYPTTVRNIGLGMCVTSSKLASVFAPFAADVGDVYKNLPSTVFGFLSIMAGLLVFLLPETKNRTLSQTLEEGRRMEEDYRFWDCAKCKEQPKTRGMNGKVINLQNEHTSEKLDLKESLTSHENTHC